MRALSLLPAALAVAAAAAIFIAPLVATETLPTDAPRPASTVVSGPSQHEADPADPEDYSTPAPSTDPNRPRVSMVSRGNLGEADVWRDSETGCQYLSYRKTHPAFFVRYTTEGRPWCGLPAEEVR